MRALTISAHGGTEQLQFRTDLPVPEPQAGSVRVRIQAAALNHLDVFMLGGLPGINITAPWVTGADGTGFIDSIADDVTSVAVGDRVVINGGISDRTCEFCLAGQQSLCVRFRLLGEHLPGTLAEYVVVPASNVRRVSDSVTIEDAAAFTLSALTAWRMVVSRANVVAGDEVLIWGIGGGVALAAMQIAKSLGARVWVTSSSDDKLERARALGADETLNHRTMNVGKEIRSRTGKRGVSVVIDSVGVATWESSLVALGRAGRLVTCGGTSGAIVETDVRRLFWNQWSIMGSTMGNHSEFEAVVDRLNDGTMRPVIDSVHTLDNGRDAYDRMARGLQFGKLVIRVAE